MNFKTNTKPQLFDKKMQKEKTLQSVYELFESREKVYGKILIRNYFH